jgi:hypothetical protein
LSCWIGYDFRGKGLLVIGFWCRINKLIADS